jgi:hypothetical protein
MTLRKLVAFFCLSVVPTACLDKQQSRLSKCETRPTSLSTWLKYFSAQTFEIYIHIFIYVTLSGMVVRMTSVDKSPLGLKYTSPTN